MVCGEVDVRDGAAVALKRMFNCTRVRVLSHIQVPYQSAVVGGRNHPVVSGGEGRPLDINNQPWQPMAAQATGWVVGRVQVNYSKTIWSDESQRRASEAPLEGTHEARAISLPDGEMVAEPTRPSTWMVPSASKLSLS